MGLFANTAVCCFALISGYFIHSVSLPTKKIVKTAGIIWFYSVLVLVLALLIPELRAYMTPSLLIVELTPILSNMSWYGSTYFVSLFFVPLIALSIRYLETRRKLFTYMIVVMASFFSIVGTVTPINSFVSDLAWFIFLYYLAIYIRTFYSKVSKKNSLLIAIAVIILVSVGWLSLWILQSRISLFGKLYKNLIGRYSFFTLALGVSLFNIFRQMEFKSRIINLIASSTFGIYLLHDNQIFRKFLWHDLFHTEVLGGDMYCFVYLILFSSIIFLCGMVIDLIRKLLLDKSWSKFSDWISLKVGDTNIKLGFNE